MKRLFALVLALTLLLCACGTPKPVETTPTEPATEPTAASTPTEPAATEPTETEATQPTEAPTVPHPLTGKGLEAPYVGRVATFSINNDKMAMPQAGISGADWLYEIETEGGITRCLGLYTDLSQVGILGPIRSARTYFNNLNLGYQGVLFHCGGSVYALNQQYDDRNTFSNWEHVNEMSYANYFQRDYARHNSGYLWEHCLYTTGAKAIQAMTDLGYYGEKSKELDYGLTFAQKVDLAGAPATEVKVLFRGNKTTTFAFDEQTGKYVASQYGKEWVDNNDGKAISFNNVMVLFAEQWQPEDYHSFYRLEGEGTGYVAINGEISEIRWSRASVNDPYTYTMVDGTPFVLNEGNTYCAIASTNGSVSYK